MTVAQTVYVQTCLQMLTVLGRLHGVGYSSHDPDTESAAYRAELEHQEISLMRGYKKADNNSAA